MMKWKSYKRRIFSIKRTTTIEKKAREIFFRFIGGSFNGQNAIKHIIYANKKIANKPQRVAFLEPQPQS